MSKKMLEKEIRTVEFKAAEFLKTEKREDGEQEEYILEGYPIVFNAPTLIGDEEWGWVETIDRGALDGADISDCCLKYNHDCATPLLARVRNGSLQLTVDEHGVFMRARLLDDDKHFYNRVKAGLLDKMSFAFTVKEEQLDYDVKPIQRKILKIGKLFDVSIVDIPAYDQTSLQARSKAMLESKPESAEADNALETLESDIEEKRKAEQEAFEFRKRKAIATMKTGGYYYE